MRLIGTIVVIAGLAGFVATFIGMTTLAPLWVWGAVVIAGGVLSILARRPSD